MKPARCFKDMVWLRGVLVSHGGGGRLLCIRGDSCACGGGAGTMKVASDGQAGGQAGSGGLHPGTQFFTSTQWVCAPAWDQTVYKRSADASVLAALWFRPMHPALSAALPAASLSPTLLFQEPAPITPTSPCFVPCSPHHPTPTCRPADGVQPHHGYHGQRVRLQVPQHQHLLAGAAGAALRHGRVRGVGPAGQHVRVAALPLLDGRCRRRVHGKGARAVARHNVIHCLCCLMQPLLWFVIDWMVNMASSPFVDSYSAPPSDLWWPSCVTLCCSSSAVQHDSSVTDVPGPFPAPVLRTC